MAKSPVTFNRSYVYDTLYPEYFVYWQGTRIGSVEKRDAIPRGHVWRAYPYDGNGTYGDYSTRRDAANAIVTRYLRNA